MLRNPEQLRRTLTSASGTDDKGITVIYADHPATGLQRAREDIEESERGIGDSVLVLGRYKSSGNALPSRSPWMEFSTVHRAKGREEDYVVVSTSRTAAGASPRESRTARYLNSCFLRLQGATISLRRSDASSTSR